MHSKTLLWLVGSTEAAAQKQQQQQSSNPPLPPHPPTVGGGAQPVSAAHWLLAWHPPPPLSRCPLCHQPRTLRCGCCGTAASHPHTTTPSSLPLEPKPAHLLCPKLLAPLPFPVPALLIPAPKTKQTPRRAPRNAPLPVFLTPQHPTNPLSFPLPCAFIIPALRSARRSGALTPCCVLCAAPGVAPGACACPTPPRAECPHLAALALLLPSPPIATTRFLPSAATAAPGHNACFPLGRCGT